MSVEIKTCTFRPQNLSELDALLQNLDAPATFVAGATDLMVRFERWKAAQNLINLDGVAELRQTMQFEDRGVLIGAALPIAEIYNHPEIQRRFPILIAALRQIGSAQIQNRATLGGNIANASPAGDSLPVLSVLNAELWIGPRLNGEFSKLKLHEVMLGPGLTSLNLEASEIKIQDSRKKHPNRYIAYIYLPCSAQAEAFWYFRKVGQRQALAISKASLALLGWKTGEKIAEVRICAGSVTAQIKRAERTETLLRGQHLSDALIKLASQQLMEEVSPITDIRSTIEYRRTICGALLSQALHQFSGFRRSENFTGK